MKLLTQEDANKLVKLIEKVEGVNLTAEYQTRTIHKVKNLSRSDRDVIIMVAEEILKNGYSMATYLGNVRKVFHNLDLDEYIISNSW